MFENGERQRRFFTRGVPALAVVTIAGVEVVASLFGGGSPRANADTPATSANSVTVESTINGVSGGETVDVSCSGFNQRVVRLSQGQGFSIALSQISREPGVSDGAVNDAIEKANGLEGQTAQPDTDYRIPEACTISG